MGDTAKIRRTITDLGFAPITEIDADGKPTYGEVVWFAHHEAGGREYDAQPAGSSGGIWHSFRLYAVSILRRTPVLPLLLFWTYFWWHEGR